MGGRILVIDDEQDMLSLLHRIITEETDHRVTTECDPEKALALVREQPFDLVITDLRMPRLDGMAVLENIKRVRPQTYILVMTAYATIETAVEAIRKGAFDYITKPFKREHILLTINKIMQWKNLVSENDSLREALAKERTPSFIVGSTPVMNAMLARLRQVAPTSATVLITGASGTGKELVARYLHYNSPRRGKEFVAINCAAIPEQIIESELFGHVKGAFSGAFRNKRGLVALAHEGTLFLDEIGELNFPMQAKLLRLIQEGEYKPVGSEITSRADLRIVAATSCDLKDRIRDGRFRDDLYYRLNVIRFELPPLKARRNDIPLLGQHFLAKYAAQYGKNIHAVSAAALQRLIDYDFPGNIRELENVIERAVVFCRSESLAVEDLCLDGDPPPYLVEVDADTAALSFKEAKEKALDLFHRQYIRMLLDKTHGNMTRAAEVADIQRPYLYRLMKEAGIEPDAFRGGGDG
jgi:DNA-binding NtrC family response regulator